MMDKILPGMKLKAVDSKPMHNFADNTEWPALDNSVFTFKPPTDEAWLISSVRIKFSVNVNLHCPMNLNYYIHGVPTAVRTTKYSSIDAFIDRCPVSDVLLFGGQGKYTHNIFSFEYQFDSEMFLWGTSPGGVNPAQNPRLHYFTMGIEDNIPYKNLDGGILEMAKIRYPGVVVYDIKDMA